MGMRMSGAERAAALAEEANPYLEEPKRGIELLSRLMSPPEVMPELTSKALQLRTISRTEFADACRVGGALPPVMELYLRLEAAVEHLEDLTEFSALANKNIVGVGGAFSAGKSKFINALLGEDMLPTDLTPTTSLPTYMAWAEEESIHAVNFVNSRVPICRDAVKAICHEFHKRHNVSFNRVVRLLLVEHPRLSWRNIAFLDTPGYTKPDAADAIDERIAREQLSLADHVLWIADIAGGTLKAGDARFLQSLTVREGRTLFVVLTKADLMTRPDAEKVVAQVREKIAEAGLPCAGVAAYDSRAGREVLGDSLADHLASLERRKKFADEKGNFSRVMASLNEMASEVQDSAGDVLEVLNLLMARAGDKLDAPTREKAVRALSTAKSRVASSKNAFALIHRMEEKTLGMVDAMLSAIKVEDGGGASAVTAGAVRTLVKVKPGVPLPKAGESLSVTVARLDALGVALRCEALGDTVPLSKAEVMKAFTAKLSELFPMGAECAAVVEDVQHARREVRLAVVPPAVAG